MPAKYIPQIIHGKARVHLQTFQGENNVVVNLYGATPEVYAWLAVAALHKRSISGCKRNELEIRMSEPQIRGAVHQDELPIVHVSIGQHLHLLPVTSAAGLESTVSAR